MKNIIAAMLFLCAFGFAGYGQQRLKIQPAYPHTGDKVIITYNPAAEGATIPDTVTHIDIVFTYSNFYEMAWKMPMVKISNSEWQTSFTIPRYGVRANFYLQSGDQKDQPDAEHHYAIIVYDKNNRKVKNSYLYEAYSLSAQSRAAGLGERQAKLYKEELKNFPGNYEAKLRFIANEMSTATEEEKVQLRKEGDKIIAAKFREKPGNMGHTNLTTMGYLIIGENSRLDSIRQVIRKQYPFTEAGYELIIGDLEESTDTAKMVKGLLSLLKNENTHNASFLKPAHKALFRYYATQKDSAKALYHLKKTGRDNSPYKPETLKEQAEVLYKNNIALNKATELAKQSLALADTFPIGIIRYFPETGYLPSYHDNATRKAYTKTVTANLKSLLGLIALMQGKDKEASTLINEALAGSQDMETMSNAAMYFNTKEEYKNAFDNYFVIAKDHPEDTLTLRHLKMSYTNWKKTDDGFDNEMLLLKKQWNEKMKAALQQEIKSIKTPEFLNHITDLEGNPVSTDMLKNKIVVLDFWATWCVPCMNEMPYLQKAYENFKSDPEVVFMVINSGAKNNLKDAKNWWGNKKFTFPVYYNADPEIGTSLDFDVIPATFIIDADNIIRFKTIGFEGPVIERKIPAAIELLKSMPHQNNR